MVRAAQRYGAGGRFEPKFGKSGVGKYRKRATTSGMLTRKGPRRTTHSSIQVQFRLDWDDHDLRVALDRMGEDGDKLTKDVLRETIQEAIEFAQEALKRKAGPLASRSVPPWESFGSSQNIYVRVADALRQDDVPGQTAIRVHTGPTLAQAQQGLIGSRGGFLSQIVAGGHRPYRYPRWLPKKVRSSVSHFVKTGAAGDWTVGMMKAASHPGFNGKRKIFDYMAAIENQVAMKFRGKAKKVVKEAADRNGFRVRL